MPEPIQAPPAPTGQPSPAPTGQEQAPPQQSSPTAPTPPATSPPGTPTAPPAAVQPNAELLALQAERDRLAESHKQAMQKITQQGQQLAQLVGATPQQPPVDQLAPFVKMLTDEGYSEKDARNVAKVQFAMMQPVLQAQQQASAAIQGTAMVGDVMRQAWTEMPQVFASNPQIGQRVDQILRNDALAGRPVDKDYAINLALIEHGRLQFGPQQTAPPVQQPQPPPFNYAWAPPGGYGAPAAPVQQKAALTPEQQQWQDDIQKTFKTNAR